jgi:hypothetical protein
VLGFNAATTGDPFTFGLVAQWGASHELGFHQGPWGSAHTPARGLAAINAYLRLMQRTAFEAPVPAVLPALAALLLIRRLSAADRYLLISGALLLLAYFSYWGVSVSFLGPRFILPIAPILMLWIARLPRVIGSWTGSLRASRAATAWIVLILISGLPGMVAAAKFNAHDHSGRRIRPDAQAARQEIHDALVLIPVSWVDELSPRLWARGVPRGEARRMTRRRDWCQIQRVLVALEQENIRGAEAVRRLMALPERARGIPVSTVGSSPLPRICLERLREERSGSWLLNPFLLARRYGNVFARDLHERTEPLLAAYAGRQVYVARPHPVRGVAQPVFVPFNADSARAVWRRRLVDQD